MGKHALDDTFDAPARDYYLSPSGVPAIKRSEYEESYNRRRIHAAHAPARYESWRFVEPDGSPVFHLYREPAWDAPGSFYEALRQSEHMLSDSDGWAPNRAAFIWAEAHTEHAARG
jgi:hypothetical protein